MSTIVGSTSEESGFVNVMKILEEERYCMERRLDLITKVLYIRSFHCKSNVCNCNLT